MTRQRINALEKELAAKCPSVRLFIQGVLYMVSVPAVQYRGRIEEEVLADGPNLNVLFRLELDKETEEKRWKIKEINGWDWREFID